ncbi:MAG: tetratricopeptide repeat protein [Bacteroidales bacterium]|nr:tetratricopeptide repeat protein [Bacteroidales bacterium]MDD7531738.1 tetratricopeptide repeat protein [Bacteroidales bacterium]MDY5743952.1 tetratricopeptide repeat protein [Candidatus Cryptobacteroides sp.]
MKRILFAAAAILSVQVAFAQVKSPEAAKAAVEKAVAATAKAENAFAANPKKVVKFGVYLAEAKAWLDAYNAPVGNAWVGADQNQLNLLMGSVKPLSSENVELGGTAYRKDIYKNCNYYFNGNGMLAMIEITNPVYEDALDKALAAYAKAGKADTKAQKTKDICLGISDVASKYVDEAYNCYTFGDLAKASIKFEKAVEAKATAPLSEVDSTSLYNAGFTAWLAGDNDRALNFFLKCREVGYFYEDGEVYSKLGDVLLKQGKTQEGVEYLKEGFVKFPQSQSILINLINYYLTSGENTDELFVLLNKAKANDPKNASLWYVEGNTHAKLGHEEEAIAAYNEASKVDPKYEYGYVGMGVYFYEKMIAIAEEANALDYSKWREYDALIEKYYVAAEQAVEPFEKAYEISADNGLKYNVAQYLKDIYFRLRNKNEAYNVNYEKYDAIVKAGKAE